MSLYSFRDNNHMNNYKSMVLSAMQKNKAGQGGREYSGERRTVCFFREGGCPSLTVFCQRPKGSERAMGKTWGTMFQTDLRSYQVFGFCLQRIYLM